MTRATTTSESDPVATLREAARRNQILDAATRVFGEKGFHRATIKEIASAAGIADGTIYNYFEDKTDLLMGLLDRLNETEERPAQLSLESTGDFESTFATVLAHRLALVEENLAVFRALLPEIVVNDDLRKRYFAEVIDEGQPRARIQRIPQLFLMTILLPRDAVRARNHFRAVVLGFSGFTNLGRNEGA